MLSNTEHSTNMSNPIPPPQLFSPQPFAPSNDIVNSWPIENEPPIEYPPFKKPRNFDDAPIQIPNPRILPPNPPVPRGTGRIFFKTRLCAKYKLGTCPYGISCSFAHGIEDLRKPPPNWKEIVASQGNEGTGNMEEDQRTFGRIKLCNKFHNGEECPYGERCNFLHEDPTKFREDPGRFRESSAISIGTTGQPFDSRRASDQSDGNGIGNSSVDFNRMNQKSFSWKTRICNKWETTGHCPFGDKCHFAHGREELQNFGYPDKTEMANPGTTPSKPLQNPGNDMSYCDTTIGDSSNQQVLRKKCLLKWKGPEKISRIYADWIDDLPLLRSSSSKVEN